MPKKREKLDIKCTDFKCAEDEHCFSPKKPPKERRHSPSICTNCGASPIEWDLLHKRDINNISILVSSLKKEHIRAYFWRNDISWVSKRRPLMIGRQRLEKKVRLRLKKSIGLGHHFREGQQTPLLRDDDPIHYAQHATATCCRKCVFYWHGIPEERDLLQAELDYLEKVIWAYLNVKLPDLLDEENRVQSELDLSL
ncbi:DUF4186 family protein [Prosthecobacter dejongeii]|nr:DUF4186 family protein [Prosthecobacter dejongeii]